MMRLLRTAAYWLRYLLRPTSVSWTDQDDHEAEWQFWEADDYRGSDGDAS